MVFLWQLLRLLIPILLLLLQVEHAVGSRIRWESSSSIITELSTLAHNRRDPSVVFFYRQHDKDKEGADKDVWTVQQQQYADVAHRVTEALREPQQSSPAEIHFYALSCHDHPEACVDVPTVPSIHMYLGGGDENESPLLSLPVQELQPDHILRYVGTNSVVAQASQQPNQSHDRLVQHGLDWILRHHMVPEPLSDAQRGLLRHFLVLVEQHIAQKNTVVVDLLLHELVSNIAYVAHSYQYRVAVLDEYFVADNDSSSDPDASSTHDDDPCTAVRALFRALHHEPPAMDPSRRDTSSTTTDVAHGVYQFLWYLGRRDDDDDDNASASCTVLHVHQHGAVSGPDDPRLLDWWTMAVGDGKPDSEGAVTKGHETDDADGCVGTDCADKRRHRRGGRRRRALSTTSDVSTPNDRSTPHQPNNAPVVLVGCSLVLLLWRFCVGMLGGGSLLQRAAQNISRRPLILASHYNGLHKVE